MPAAGAVRLSVGDLTLDTRDPEGHPRQLASFGVIGTSYDVLGALLINGLKWGKGRQIVTAHGVDFSQDVSVTSRPADRSSLLARP
jgi:hypothetical protein